MSTITFVTPNSISQKEFIALRENRFELHCLNMKLTSLAPKGKVFSGPGMIQQTPEGKLHFILFAREKISIIDFVQQFTGDTRVPVGSIIPKDEYYQLSAQDLKGRNWICEQVSPAIDSSSDEGTICTGNLTEIIYTNDEAETKKEILYLEIFDNQIKLPYNARTVINKNIAGKESVSMSLNVLQYSVGEVEFLVQRETESLLLTATSTNSQFVEHFDLRVIESLQFVLARPLRWSIMIKLTNGCISTYIRDTQPDNLKYRVQPPISLTLDSTDAFCEIFGRYLKYVSDYSESKLHPVSAQMRSICLASIGTIETKSLILSVAVESILKHIHETEYQLSPEEEEWIEKAREYFSSWDGPENLSNRITGLFSVLPNPSASIRLKEMVELGAITQEQRGAWSRLRNKLAHGEGLGSASMQEFLELSNIVLVLFYHLVFFATGYQGRYTDYSTIGWPVKDYKVTPQPE